MNYVTLYEAKQQLGLSQSAGNDDNRLNYWIAKSTELIRWWKQTHYDIHRGVVYLDCPRYENLAIGNYDGINSIDVDYRTRKSLKTNHLDLLEITKLLNGDLVEIVSSDYFTEGYGTCINRIFLTQLSGLSWKYKNSDYKQAIELTGYFGFNSSYPLCFIKTGEVVPSGGFVAEVSTSFTATDVNGQADDLISPRIQAGQMFRLSSVNGIEFIFAKTVSGNVVTFLRGQNGTTALAHPQNTPVEVYRVDGAIQQACLRLVHWRYRQKDSDNFDKIYSLANQAVVTPSALPVDVRSILGRKGRLVI
jgi:hypothetical protein